MSKTYAVIMAGGRGERFWPLSTNRVPKPFLPLLGSTTLIQQTVERFLPSLPPDRMLISIGEAHAQIAREQLPQIPPENFVLEPVGRDTAACLAFCALIIEKRDPDAIMLAVPADHFVADPAACRRSVEKGIRALQDATAVVFGILPSRPDTGYGYIQVSHADPGSESLPVVRFVEKPGAARAREYLDAGNYYWNSGMFLWRNRTLLGLFQKHMPEMQRGLETLRPLIGRDDARADLAAAFAALPRISIDFGVMEKTTGLRLIPAEFSWDDIGNWGALDRALPRDAGGNVCIGRHLALESGGCIAYSDAGTVAIFGVSDLIVVQAHGKVLVCPKDRATDLKRLISCLPAE